MDILCSDGGYCFSPRVIITLLSEAENIPVMFASVSSTGFVMLEVRYLTFSHYDCFDLYSNFTLFTGVFRCSSGIRFKQRNENHKAKEVKRSRRIVTLLNVTTASNL